VELRGVADLPLHVGHVPKWLFDRMRRLSRLVIRLMYLEYGERGIVDRIANPVWFQALSNLVGMDWDSSGSTTILTAVLREALLQEDVGVRVLGGKGKRALSVPEELRELRKHWDLDVEELTRVSRLTAKVDSVLLQDGYNVYHHALVVSRDGYWAVVQQGMSPSKGLARRYHWASTTNFLDDPHKGIIGVREDYALNLASSRSSTCRRVILDVVRDGSFRRDLLLLAGQTSVLDFLGGNTTYYHPYLDLNEVRREVRRNYRRIIESIPRDVVDFEDFLMARGVGALTIRALALVAELVYRAEVDWRDPAMVDPFKFSFAVGGKDGVPYPVDKRTYDELLHVLEAVIDVAVRRGDRSVVNYLKRLSERMKAWRPPCEFKRPTP